MLRFDEDFRDLSPSFGGRLSVLRALMGMTQDDLARSVGVSRSLISAFENGRRWPSIEIAQDLAGALGVPHEELLSVLLSRRIGREVELPRIGRRSGQSWRGDAH